MNNYTPKIFDCFPFFNELDILDLRLHELNDVVDYFVIAEANSTHTSNSKPYYFEANKDRFRNFLDKIIYIKIDDLPGNRGIDDYGNPSKVDWRPENWQREALFRGLWGKAKNGDKIFISDCDEIWDKSRLAFVRNLSAPCTFVQKMFFYYVNTHLDSVEWPATVMATYGNFLTQQLLRDKKDSFLQIRSGGWHLSYQGGPLQVKTKIDNIAESKYALETMSSIQEIEDKILRLYDPLERATLKIDAGYLPHTIKSFIQKYPKYWYHGKRESVSL